MRQKVSSKEFLIVLLLLLTKLLIHLFTNTNYEIHRDGLLYYSLGQNLAWGYASVPPFIAWVSKVSVVLFGHNTFALRFFPLLIGLLSILTITGIVSNLGGRWKAILIAGLAFIFSPAFLRSNTLLQPVSFNQFFWLLTVYLVIKMVVNKNPKMWILISVTLGLAFLNKYSIVFFAFSLFIVLLFSRHRWLYQSKYFLIGILVGVLVALPNIIWQYNHNWPVIHHMNELYKHQLVNVSSLGFIIDQFIMNFPGLIVWLAGLIVFLFSYNEKSFRFIPLVFLLTLIIILYNHGKSYYTLGLYTSMFALGAYAIEKYWKNYVIMFVSVFIIGAGILMAPISLPIFSFQKLAEFTKPIAEFTNRWEDGKIYELPQDFADMTGWEQLAEKADSCIITLPEYQKKQTFVFAENYGHAGALMFYNHKSEIKPVSFSDSFLLWAPEKTDAKNLLMINYEIDGFLAQFFDTCYVMAQVNDKYFRENGVKVIMYQDANQEFNEFYSNKYNDLISKYKRPIN